MELRDGPRLAWNEETGRHGIRSQVNRHRIRIWVNRHGIKKWAKAGMALGDGQTRN